MVLTHESVTSGAILELWIDPCLLKRRKTKFRGWVEVKGNISMVAILSTENYKSRERGGGKGVLVYRSLRDK